MTTNGSTDTPGRGPRFVVIGAGMAGILAAIRLREAGHTNLAVYEKADRPGGTWRENTYPGVACDVPSHLYSYSFAPNPDWSHVFSPGAEICSYLENVARFNHVAQLITYGAEVTAMGFDGRCWQIELADGRHDQAEFVIAATGVLHHPAYPDIEGIDTFAGAIFHSARWDHTAELQGARLGVVGTGSSAVQITTATVDTVSELALFQRTPQWVLSVDNPPISDEQREQYHADPTAMAAVRAELAASFEANFANAVVDADSPQLQALEALCRANLEDNVSDPVLREKLRPDYRAACKRLIVSPGFYQAITRPNARLVTQPIKAIEKGGIRTADGVLHHLDVIVLATGFRVDRFLRPIKVSGRDGVELERVWAQRPSAYLSISVPGFPNLFMLNGPNGPVGNFSLIDVAEAQLDYILALIRTAEARGATQIAVRPEAAERFEAERVEAAARTVWVTGCRSWYLDDRGIPAAWPWSFDRFRSAMARPNLEDFELTGTPQPSLVGEP